MKQEANLYSLICRPLNPSEQKLKEDLWWMAVSGSSLFIFLIFFILISGECGRPLVARRRRVLSNGSITEQALEV